MGIVFLAFSLRPFATHQLLILFRIGCVISTSVFASGPQERTQMSSAKRIALHGPVCNWHRRLFITRFQTNGDKIPPWGVPLDGKQVIFVSLTLAKTVLFFR